MLDQSMNSGIEEMRCSWSSYFYLKGDNTL